MRNLLFLLFAVFLISGCELPKNAATKDMQEEVLAEQEIMEETAQDMQVALEAEVAEVLVEEKMQAGSEEIKVEAIVLAREDAPSIIRTIDEIITENRWGFSIYDPKAGTVEYYASRGSYLGKRSMQ